MKRRLQKKFGAITIRKYSPLLKGFLPIFKKFAEEFNPAEYRKHAKLFRHSMEKELDLADRDSIKTGVIQIFKNIDLYSYSKEANKGINYQLKISNGDETFKELNQLVNEAEKICPNIFFGVFMRNNPFEMFIKGLEPYDLIHDFKSLRGEKAARTAIRIYREVAESIYDHYIRSISELISIIEGRKRIVSNQSFGTLLNQMHKKLNHLGYFQIVKPDVSFLRNACCHGDWQYDLDSDEIFLSGNNKKLIKYTPSALYDKAMELYTIAGADYFTFFNLYMKKKLFNEWLPILKYCQRHLLSIINCDQNKISFIQGRFEKEFLGLRDYSFLRN